MEMDSLRMDSPHLPCCQVVSSISELRYSNEHTILQSSASDLWIQFRHCSCWSFFFVVCVFLDLIFPFVTSCLSLVSWMLKHLSYCSPSLLCMAICLVIITFLLILLLIQQWTDWEKCADFLSVLLFSCSACRIFLTAAVCFKSYDWCQPISQFFSWDKIFQTTWQQSLPPAMTQFLWSGEDHHCC